MLGLISSFLSNQRPEVVLDGKSSQKYPVNPRVPQGYIFGPAIFYYSYMTFLMMLSVILLSMQIIPLHILNVIRHLISGNNLNWLLNLNLIYGTVECGKKWLVDFNAETIQLGSFDWSNSNDSIDVNKDGSVLEAKLSFNVLGLTSSSKLDWGYYSKLEL